MPVQEYTQEELTLVREAAAILLTSNEFLQANENRTKAEQKAFKVAFANSKIADLDTQIAALDTYFDNLKAEALLGLNAKKSVIESYKAKTLNSPE